MGCSGSTEGQRGVHRRGATSSPPTTGRTNAQPPQSWGKRVSLDTSATGHTNNSSSFFADVGHLIDMFNEAARSHLTQYWMWYTAAAISAILICLMLCYRKQLAAICKSMLERRKQTQSVSPAENVPEQEENDRNEIVIVPNGSQPLDVPSESAGVGQDPPMDFVV